MVELVDSPASGAGVRKDVRVRLPPRAPNGISERVSRFLLVSTWQNSENLRFFRDFGRIRGFLFGAAFVAYLQALSTIFDGFVGAPPVKRKPFSKWECYG